jgi:Protein of unknown function (DUF2924)
METIVAREVAALQRMTTKQLCEKYAAVFGEATNGRNKAWLVRRIAWRIRALAEGDLTERARAQAAELARDADLRTTAPKHRAVPAAEVSGPRNRTSTPRPSDTRRRPAGWSGRPRRGRAESNRPRPTPDASDTRTPSPL